MRHKDGEDIFKKYRPIGLTRSQFEDCRFIAEDNCLNHNRESTIKSDHQKSVDVSQDKTRMKKKAVLELTRKYIDALYLKRSIQREMSKTFDYLFPLIPNGSKLCKLPYLAEIVVFHVLKKKNLLNNPTEFERVSLLGNMSLNKRPWLLKYTRYLPKSARIHTRMSFDSFLNFLYEYPGMTKEFEMKCERIKESIANKCGNINPRIVAGIICHLAFNSIKPDLMKESEVLDYLGIFYPGSIDNAINRLKSRGIRIHH